MVLKKRKKIEPEEEGYEGLDIDELEEEEIEGIEKKPKIKKVKKRFVVFAQQPRMGIVDSETNEVLAEGDLGVFEALANILERLERMETTIGSLVE